MPKWLNNYYRVYVLVLSAVAVVLAQWMMGGIEREHVILICVVSYLFLWSRKGGGEGNGLSRAFSF